MNIPPPMPPTGGDEGAYIPLATAPHFLYARILLNKGVEFHQTCMDKSLGQA